MSMVKILVPSVSSDADVHRSRRWVLTGLDEQKEGTATVLGPEVGHGAVIETAPGALLLVMDQRITGWAEAYYGGKPYPVLDAALDLQLVQEDGALKSLWSRHFKTAKAAFGKAALGQLRKHLAARPPTDDLRVRTVEEGPGRPNFKPGPCRWCGEQLAAGRGVLVGRGEEAQIEHPRRCSAPSAAPGEFCALCSVAVAPGTAEVVLVRAGEGRREVRHRGRCEEHPSYQEYERRQAEEREAAAARRAAERAAEEKRERRRAAAAEKRRAAREARETAARAAAEATRERFDSLDIVEVTSRQELYDKGLSPYGERMRLVEVTAVLSDGAPATWWEVAAYGGDGEDGDDRGGRYFLLEDARAEYQRYTYQVERYTPSRRRARVGDVACPADGARHCDHCGGTESEGGWMTASLGLACGTDCYTAMSDDRGAHARQYHRAR
jgi:hypothetical protein